MNSTMFSTQHIIWLIICIVLIAVALYLLKRYKVPLNKVLNVVFICVCVSELVKTLYRVNIVSTADGGYTPYIETYYLPLHLCSVQVILLAVSRFMKPGKKKDMFLSVMYPMCIVAVLGLVIPTCFETVGLDHAFSSVLPYQYFFHHSVLLMFGLYVPLSGEVRMTWKNEVVSLLFLLVMAYACMYLNSLLATVHYEDGSPVVEYIPNFFYVFGLPDTLTFVNIYKKWHWLVYLLVIACIAIAVFTLIYLPVFIVQRKQEKRAGEAFRGDGDMPDTDMPDDIPLESLPDVKG